MRSKDYSIYMRHIIADKSKGKNVVQKISKGWWVSKRTAGQACWKKGRGTNQG